MIVNNIEIKIHPVFTDYAISKCGKIYSLPRRGRNNQKLGGWIKSLKDGNAYLIVSLWKNEIQYKRRIHRLVLETFVGPCPEGMECRHLDGDSYNNNLNNLCWGTRILNHKDKIKHGTSLRGVKNPQAKLTDGAVRDIRAMYITGLFSRNILVEIFGVCRQSIDNIINKKTWSYL